MFVDASTLVAILTEETGWEDLLLRLKESSSGVQVSPLVRFETVLAVARVQSNNAGFLVSKEALAAADRALAAFLEDVDAGNVDLTEEIGASAVDAAMRYGKVVRHPARLNLGDCFAYACAKSLGAPLLYKGGEFALTDLA